MKAMKATQLKYVSRHTQYISYTVELLIKVLSLLPFSL